MAEEHPQGVTKFAGFQKRYLLQSGHGYLGGIVFAASALYLSACDAWMGWDSEQRDQYHSHVVGLKCKNLASHLLAGSPRRMRTHTN